MFRTNDPSWSTQMGREGPSLRTTQGVDGDGVEHARAGARMVLTHNQIGIFMKQGQTDFMNSPG